MFVRSVIVAEQTVVTAAPAPYFVRVQRPQAHQPTRPSTLRPPAGCGPPFGIGRTRRAYRMRASYGLPYVTPDLVLSLSERGQTPPSGPELTALASVLVFARVNSSARQGRCVSTACHAGWPRRTSPVPSALNSSPTSGWRRPTEWRGNDRQSVVLADTLELSLRDFITVTGRDDKVAELLRSAVTTRWQAYVRPVGKMIPLDRRLLEDVLQAMHSEYQGQMVATLSWSGGSAAADADRDSGLLPRPDRRSLLGDGPENHVLSPLEPSRALTLRPYDDQADDLAVRPEKTDSASSIRSFGTVFSSVTASASGTISTSVPRSAVIRPKSPRCAASTARQRTAWRAPGRTRSGCRPAAHGRG